MAVKSLYFKNVTANGALSLQDGGTAPATGITTTGWAVGKIAVNNYSLMLAGTERATGTFSTTNALTTPAFSASSCFRSENPFWGTFANSNWTLAFRVRAVSLVAAQAGRILCRLWKSKNADGSGATELTSAVLSGTVTSTLSTTVSQTSTVTWTPGSTRLFDSEYLWVQCEWMITTLGTGNNADVDFYIESAGVVTTPDFVAIIGGTGALTNPDGSVAVGAGSSESTGDGALTNPDGADLDAEGTAEAGSGVVPWTPADVIADVIAWYDFADTGTVLQSGGFLTQWQDKSGNARHGNAMSAALAINTDGIYTPAASGANAGIQMPALPSAYFDFAFAGKPNGPTGNYRTLMAQAIGGQHHVLVEVSTTRLGSYAASFFQAGTLTWPEIDGQIYYSGPNATSIQIGRDGATPLDETGENFGPDNAPFLMNYSVAGGQGFGTVREFVFMAAGRSQDIRDRVSGYLAHKWDAFLGVTTHVDALPAEHPYKAAPPTIGAAEPATGTGVLAPEVSTVAASGQTASSGTAALNQLGASLSGAGLIRATGTATLATGTSAVVSAGLVRAIGTATLTTASAAMAATGTAVTPPAYGVGDINATASGLAAGGAVGNIISGGGILVAAASSTGGVAPWTPDLLAGLSAHLDASGLGLEDGASILTWPNLASGGMPPTVEWNFTPVTYKADALNGRGVARFSSGNSSHVHGKTNATGRFTVVFIVRRWGPTVGRCFSSQYPPTNLLVGFHSTGQDIAYDGGNWLTAGTAWGGYPDVWKMYGMEAMDDPPTSTFTVNGVWKAQSGVGASGGLGGGYALSSYRGDSQVDETMDCDIAEMVLYDKLISQAERKQVEGYLAHKWGLTGNLAVDHPYKTVMPMAGVSSGGLVGSTGTGALTATGSVIAGVGLSVSFGGGALTTATTVVAGTGGSAQTTVQGTGAFVPLSASLSGVGLNRWAGTSVLFAGAATSAGAGLGTTTGTGVLTSVGASLLGSANMIVTGTGVLGYGVSRVSPVNMVSNTAPPPYVTGQSNELTGYEAWHAFDGNPAAPAHSNDPIATIPYWLKIDLGQPRSVASYKYQARNTGPYHAWKTWTLEGSNDDSGWDLVDTVVNEPVFAISELRSYDCDTPSIYRYWRWSVTATSGISGTYAEVGTLELVSSAGLAFCALLASGTSRSFGSGALVSSDVEVIGSEALSFLGGQLRMREAKVVGTGTSSARGYGDLLPHLAA